jgi:hypothetical protein
MHHKLHGPQFGNNSCVKYIFYKFVWNRSMDVIHLLILFEHQCHAHCLNTNVTWIFVFFRLKCGMSIHVVYTQKLWIWISCVNNAWQSCWNNTNLWNNRLHMDLEQTHEACKFVMWTFLRYPKTCSLLSFHPLASTSPYFLCWKLWPFIHDHTGFFVNFGCYPYCH